MIRRHLYASLVSVIVLATFYTTFYVLYPYRYYDIQNYRSAYSTISDNLVNVTRYDLIEYLKFRAEVRSRRLGDGAMHSTLRDDDDPLVLGYHNLLILKTIQDMIENGGSELSILEVDRIIQETLHRSPLTNNVKLCDSLRVLLDNSISLPSACLSLELQELALTTTTESPNYDPEQFKIVDNNNINNIINNHNNDPRIANTSLDHFLLCTDSLISAMAVINSTVSTYAYPERIVFHVVTNAQVSTALRMWVVLLRQQNHEAMRQACIHVQEFHADMIVTTRTSQTNTTDGRKLQFKGASSSAMQKYSNPFNHIRFYLPFMFPYLDRIMVFDDDIIVQRDLSALFAIPFSKTPQSDAAVVLGVEDCGRRFKKLFNFTRPEIREAQINPEECRIFLGFNMFNLRAWVEHDITGVYESWLAKQREARGALWLLGSLPPAMATLSGKIAYLDPYWHMVDLGWLHGLSPAKLQEPASLHWNGVHKPWQSAGFVEYKSLWLRHMDPAFPLYKKCDVAGLA
eukprot:TRINITY_DN1855_c1_g1_i1.p1 TRINITY_DN1855_c1_g1~~TRINITY_DN1855_c1_g1_i1.p1  ORF type:complete len:515 (-),score=59.03 TRINITY_DN1855_c1_g1_i1:147-1691(-)